jgi:hypothetical protein
MTAVSIFIRREAANRGIALMFGSQFAAKFHLHGEVIVNYKYYEMS